MLKLLKQARAALSMLNPDEVRKRAERSVRIGLVARNNAGYDEMEEFLIPASTSLEERTYLLDHVHRASDSAVPPTVDLILFEEGVPTSKGTYTVYTQDPSATIHEILSNNDDLSLPLARQFPVFRSAVIERTIHGVALENALFAVATALPDVVPSLVELPWALGEFASDTAFITGNQVRMAFVIAAACNHQVGFSQQRTALVSIAAGALGWRALARELAGKIPLGAGLVPKGAIAYAGTYAVGKSLEYFYRGNGQPSRALRQEIYREALTRGRSEIEQATIREEKLTAEG
jgi:hypothetical protein